MTYVTADYIRRRLGQVQTNASSLAADIEGFLADSEASPEVRAEFLSYVAVLEALGLKRGDTATPTETEWDVRFGVTALGAFTTHIISAAPTEVKRVFVLLAPALAWMYPGPGETRALQEIERLCAENKKLRAYYDTFDSILGGTDPGKTPVQP